MNAGPATVETTDVPATSAGERAPWSAWWAVLVLMLLALYTIADRPMLNLQIEPLRKELGLSDLQIGLVQGVSVALFTAFVGYPIAWLADRFDRRLVLAVSIALWSVSLALLGLSRSFEQMFLASAFVGVGEAGLIPIALAIIPELFRRQQRQLANSLLLLAGRLGVGIVVAMCGWLILAVDTWRTLLPEALQSLSGWRLSLLAVALPGLVLVPMILTLPRTRAHLAPPAPGTTATATTAVLPYLRRHRLAFASFYFGVAAMVFGIGAVMNFAPVLAMRQMGATSLQVGNLMGAATFIASLLGFALAQGGYRQLSSRVGPRLPAAALMVATVSSGLLAAALLLAKTPLQLFVGVGAFLTAVMAGTLLFPLALQEMTPAALRGRLVSIAITMNIVLGSLGPAAVGAVSDRLKDRPDGLLLAMVGVGVGAMVLATLLLVPLQARYVATVQAASRA